MFCSKESPYCSPYPLCKQGKDVQGVAPVPLHHLVALTRFFQGRVPPAVKVASPAEEEHAFKNQRPLSSPCMVQPQPDGGKPSSPPENLLLHDPVLPGLRIALPNQACLLWGSPLCRKKEVYSPTKYSNPNSSLQLGHRKPTSTIRTGLNPVPCPASPCRMAG